MLPPGAHVFSQKEQPINCQAVFPDIAMKEYFSYRKIQF